MDTAGLTRQWILFHLPTPTYPTYIIKSGLWPTILKFFNNLSEKLIGNAQQNSHQTCKEVKWQPFGGI